MNRKLVITAVFLAAVLLLLLIGHLTRGALPTNERGRGSTVERPNQVKIAFWDAEKGKESFGITAELKHDATLPIGRAATEQLIEFGEGTVTVPVSTPSEPGGAVKPNSSSSFSETLL